MKSSIQIQVLCGPFFLLCLIDSFCCAAERTMEPPEQPPAAGALFRQLVEAQKPDRALWAYMDAWLDETGFEHLRDYLHARIKAGGQTADELRSLALLCERLDETDDSLAALTLAAKNAPGDDRIWLAGARILARRSDAEAALACIDRISPTAPSSFTNEVVNILGLFTERGEKGKEALARLEAISGNRSYDDETRVQAAGWLARHSRGVALPLIEAGFSAAKIDQQREKWRLLLVRTSENDSEVTRECLAGIEHSGSGSVEEGEFIDCLERLASYKGNSLVVPLAVAEKFISRPAVVMAMKDAMRARDDKLGASAIAALLVKANPGDAFFRSQWIDALADAGKVEEAASALRERVDTSPADDAARVQLALVLRDAGRLEEGASVLETWATSAGPDAARVRRVANLLPLFRSSEEAQAWETQARKNLPAAELKMPMLKPDQATGRRADLAKQINDEWIKTGSPVPMLFKMHRQTPDDDVVTLELSKQMRERHQPVEHLHLALHQHYAAPNRASCLLWWRRMAREANIAWMTSGIFSTPTEAHRLLSLRFDLADSPEYWVSLGEMVKGRGAWPYREALRFAPEDVDARKGFLAAMADDLGWKRDPKPTGRIRRAALPLISGHDACFARLLLAEVDLFTKNNEQALRAVLELMDAPGFDEYQAERVALRIMQAGEWRAAAVFLHAQVRRFPADMRLAYLHGVALKKSGDTDGAIDAIMRLGSVHHYVTRQPLMVEGANDDGLQLAEERTRYESEMRDIGLVVTLANAIPSALDRTSYSAFGSLGFTAKPRISSMVPDHPIDQGFYAMAHLVEMAESLTPAKRHEVAARAREAGLPMPAAIEFGKIVFNGSNAKVVAGTPASQEALNDPFFAEFWLCTQLASPSSVTFRSNATSSQIKWVTQCSKVLRHHNPGLALKAALVWWGNDHESASARAAVVKCIDQCSGADLRIDDFVVLTLRKLPFKIRREEAGATALQAAIDRWGERVKQQLGQNPFGRSRTLECHLLLGRWETAGRLADEISRESYPSFDARMVMPVDERLELGRIDNSQWHDEALANTWLLLPSCFPPTSAELKEPVLKEPDKPAFRAAIKFVHDRHLRVLWHLATNDEAAAVAEVRAWIAEEPTSSPAIRVAAALALHEGEVSRALDLLHRLVISSSSVNEQLLARLDIVRAAVCGVDGIPRSRQEMAVTADAVEKARVIALQLLPALSRSRLRKPDEWEKALRVLGINPELIRETFERSKKRRDDIGAAVHWGETQMERPFPER